MSSKVSWDTCYEAMGEVLEPAQVSAVFGDGGASGQPEGL